MDNWSDTQLRKYLLSQAAVSTTALALVDHYLPDTLLTLVLRSYLVYFQTLTGARAIELYTTGKQERALDRLGWRTRLVSYHIPWQKEVFNLARLVSTFHPRPVTATIHAYEWVSHFYAQETGRMLFEIPSALGACITTTHPSSAALDLLDEARQNQVIILFETVVDRELYSHLAAIGQSRQTYLFQRLDYVRRLRDAWLARHPGEAAAPVGIVLNPWHAAIEMRGPRIIRALREKQPIPQIRQNLLDLLTTFYRATENMVQRFYVGNSRSWELYLPEILQRGHFLDPAGIVPELPLLRQILSVQPELARAITLEASPQSALFSGRLAVGNLPF